MSTLTSKILPEKAENDYKGYKVAEIIFLILTIVTIIRSLIHFLAPDGGAGSIATIDLGVEGAEIIISIFALWGSSQLLMAIIYLIVFFRYKNLIPLMYILIIAEYIMRIIVGLIKPFETTGIAPGAVWNYIAIPLALMMFLLSILEPDSKNQI
ncbi:MAG: hypothetical protein ACQERB_12070 [Promethearchaeati archaeon]